MILDRHAKAWQPSEPVDFLTWLGDLVPSMLGLGLFLILFYFSTQRWMGRYNLRPKNKLDPPARKPEKPKDS